MRFFLLSLALLWLAGCGGEDGGTSPDTSASYPVHSGITSTVFWIGETGSEANANIPNLASAWDEQWMEHYGGIDDPDRRNGYLPADFTPHENPFYIALPFNDFDANGDKRSDLDRYVPWATEASGNDSILKNRWVRIDKNGKTAYAQWEDVGPFGEDDWPYVFGTAAPANPLNNNAGLDVSPAVRDYLGLADIDIVDWRFVEAADVADGPWKSIITTRPVSWLGWYRPGVDTSWQWQLSGTVNTAYDVDLYDIDLFDSGTDLIQGLHAQGRKVICYFSAGSYEDWRSDKAVFPAEVLGKALDGWEGERWLDIRAEAVRSIMQSRLDLAASKGCDGVEPDNVDGYSNDSGFPLTAADQLDFNRFLATEAHARGLAIGLKNDLDQIVALTPFFDFSVNEQCHEFNECDAMQPFIDAGKPVFNAEYRSDYENNTGGARDALCADALARRFQTLVLPLLLDDSSRFACETP